MILKCLTCGGTKVVFRPGKANPEPCSTCSDDGLVVDAIIAVMRAHGGECQDDAIKLVCGFVPGAEALTIWGNVKERLGQW